MIRTNNSFSVSSAFDLEPIEWPTAGREVLFVDSGVDYPELLLSSVLPTVEAHLLQPGQDPVAQMTAILAGQQTAQPVQRVHVLSHGSPGCLHLGETELSWQTVDDYAVQLRSWFTGAEAAGIQPSLLLYGCNVAVGDAGAELLEKLHRYTKAGIAASNDLTGHVDQGGNWELAVRTGVVDAKAGFVTDVFSEDIMASYPSTFGLGAELLRDILPGSDGSLPENLTVVGDKLFFTIEVGDSNGRELWVTDGTEAGTTFIDINPGPDSSFPFRLTAVEDKLFFIADNGSTGHELWVSDGTTAGTTLVKDIALGSDSPEISALTAVEDKLLFTLEDDSTFEEQLWVSDGTSEGTTLLNAIDRSSASLAMLGDKFFFS